MPTVGRTSLVGTLAAALLMAGCAAETVAGTAGPVIEEQRVGSDHGQSAEPTEQSRPRPAAPDGPLVDDVVADECLLTAAEVTDLLGRSVQPPAQTDTPRADGLRVPSCVTSTVDGATILAVNVYGTAATTPAEHIRAVPPNAGRRELISVGEAAAVVRTGTGTVLQAARGPFLVTINVLRGTPSDGAWRTAGTAALTRLPS